MAAPAPVPHRRGRCLLFPLSPPSWDVRRLPFGCCGLFDFFFLHQGISPFFLLVRRLNLTLSSADVPFPPPSTKLYAFSTFPYITHFFLNGCFSTGAVFAVLAFVSFWSSFVPAAALCLVLQEVPFNWCTQLPPIFFFFGNFDSPLPSGLISRNVSALFFQRAMSDLSLRCQGFFHRQPLSDFPEPLADFPVQVQFSWCSVRCRAFSSALPLACLFFFKALLPLRPDLIPCLRFTSFLFFFGFTT